MKSDRQAVNREFGMIKKPMDLQKVNLLMTNSGGGRTPVSCKILKTSPRARQTEDEEERSAVTERSSSQKKNRSKLKLEELLQ
jgi:hypothetical protein